MPYLANGTLLDRLHQGPLDPREGGRLVDQISSALMLAHQNGVIHRDVKPSNVLIDDEGNALLSDFSFARAQDASQNLTGSALIGTPAYMSPEQCRGDPIDARSDQYSFAVMLFQITTGSLPFAGDTPMATALQHINVPLPRPRQVNPNLPEEVELVLIKALAKDPALRFESIEALNRAFQAALAIVLEPKRQAAAGGRTLSAQRTLAMYNKYQNVKPREGRGRISRSVVLATLLLLLACVVSAGAIGVIYQETFWPVAAAPSVNEATVQAIVEATLAAGGPPPATGISPEEWQTAVSMAVRQTIEASGAPTESAELENAGPIATPTPTPSGATAFPTQAPSSTRTLKPGETPATSTRTPTPSQTLQTPIPTATGGVTSVPTSTQPATSTNPPTSGPTDTQPPPPTSTAPPPTSPPPPTATQPPPTSTPEGCWPPQSQRCRQTATAQAGGG
jgi:serine/threonine protein kinase